MNKSPPEKVTRASMPAEIFHARIAATVNAQAPVPHAKVGPAPRSQTFIFKWVSDNTRRWFWRGKPCRFQSWTVAIKVDILLRHRRVGAHTDGACLPSLSVAFQSLVDDRVTFKIGWEGSRGLGSNKLALAHVDRDGSMIIQVSGGLRLLLKPPISCTSLIEPAADICYLLAQV